MVKYYVKLQTLLASRKRSKGQSLAEYGLILALIACVCIVAMTAMGEQIKTLMETITQTLTKANAPAAGG